MKEKAFLGTSLTSQPWDATTMREMRMDTSGDTTIITYEDFATKKLLRTGATSFTISDFAFEAHSSGYPRYVPYYNFSEPSVTITPSGTTRRSVERIIQDLVAADILLATSEARGRHFRFRHSREFQKLLNLVKVVMKKRQIF